MLSSKNSTEAQIVVIQEKLDRHLEEFEGYCARIDRRWDAFIASQEVSTQLLKELVKSNSQLSDSTRDIVRVWKAADGTVKTLSTLGRFVKWIGGFTVLGAAFSYLAHSIVK